MIASIEFCFDYSSPWAYLANELLKSRFGDAPVSFTPIYLRGLEAFASGLPYSPAKLQYIAQDVARVARHERIAMKAPSNFPINGLYALRGALVAERAGMFAPYHEAMFRAAWAEDRDVSKKDTVVDIASKVGVPGFAEAIEDAAIKEALKKNTERAVARGLFGVPSFFVGEKLFWGQDRMNFAKRTFDRAKEKVAP